MLGGLSLQESVLDGCPSTTQPCEQRWVPSDLNRGAVRPTFVLISKDDDDEELVGNYASPRQASDTIARTATCTDPPFGAVFQTTPTPSHTIVAVLRRRLTLRSRAKAAPRSNLHCKGRMYPQQQRAAGATLGYPSHKIAPLASKMRPPERLRRCRDAAGALPRSERRGRRRCGNERARETAGPRPNPPAGPRSRTQKPTMSETETAPPKTTTPAAEGRGRGTEARRCYRPRSTR